MLKFVGMGNANMSIIPMRIVHTMMVLTRMVHTRMVHTRMVHTRSLAKYGTRGPLLQGFSKQISVKDNISLGAGLIFW